MNVRFNTDKIRKHITALGVSGHSFAYDCSVGRKCWDTIMTGNANPRLENAYKIAKGMGVKVDDLLIIEE